MEETKRVPRSEMCAGNDSSSEAASAEGEARVSPCHGESRWVSLRAPCSSNASHSGRVGPATPLDGATRATLAEAVRTAPLPWRLNRLVRNTTINAPGAVKNGSCTTEADGVSAIAWLDRVLRHVDVSAPLPPIEGPALDLCLPGLRKNHAAQRAREEIHQTEAQEPRGAAGT